MDILGRWHGFASQAILGKTPLRVQKPGKIADLIFENNGKCYTEKKNLFGRIKQTEYDYVYDPKTNTYGMFSTDFGTSRFWAVVTVNGNELMWRYDDDVGLGLGGMCLFFMKE